MKVISQFVVRVFDLVEAEGRSLRSVVRGEARGLHAAAAQMALGVAILMMAVPLVVGGIALLAASFMWWLETQVSRPLAAFLTGLLILAAGSALLGCFKLLSAKAPHDPEP